jgi:hypothetical protein
MSADLIVERLVARLTRQFGPARQLGRGRVLAFGDELLCSINYSKILRGEKFFYAVPRELLTPSDPLPEARLGAFAVFICGGLDRVLVVPRQIIVEMLAGVPTRRVDIFNEGESLILQTTRHPKLDVTAYLDAFPTGAAPASDAPEQTGAAPRPARAHVRMQAGLIQLGRVEGCKVWVPINDRNLAHDSVAFSSETVAALPRFGFDENTRRIVQNIDVLWLRNNVIERAFEIESTTSVYSGLLRMNDLVLAQPNVLIDLNVVAPEASRQRVASQLARPSFRTLAPKVQYVTFGQVDECIAHLSTMPRHARVSGLLQGVRLSPDDMTVHPEYI